MSMFRVLGVYNFAPPPLVEIGLTDLSKSGGAMAPPAPPETTGLYLLRLGSYFLVLSTSELGP